MKNAKLITLLFALVFAGIVGCSKKGDTGPAGAAGAAGAPGAPGATGPAGPAGPDSIVYSNWTVLAMTDDAGTFSQTIAAPAITQDILDKGIILSYIGDPNGAVAIASDYFAIIYSPATIDLVSQSDWSGFSFRYVVVPGTILAGSSISSGPAKGYTKQQLMGMSYADIVKLFGIKGNVGAN